ncbi:MAG: putative lipid II flippase FtsW [Patescibacteria group bacterium]
MARSRDPILFGLIIFFIVFGFLALTSASLGLIETQGAPFKIIYRQAVFGLGLGTLLFCIAEKINYRFWHKAAFWIFLLSSALTLLVFFPGIGFKSGGSARWLTLGPLTIQPSEFLKLGFVIYLAAWITSRGREIRSIQYGALPMLVMILFLGALFVKQPDLGTMGVAVATGFILFFIGGASFRHISLVAAVILALTASIIYFKPYMMDRVLVFLNPFYDPQGSGYQIRQAAIALGSGGLFGKGFGASVQKFRYLPEPAGDAVFAVIGEEFGFAGTGLLVLFFIFFLWRSLILFKRIPDIFARLLGSGIVIMIIVQAFINMGALTGLLPLTGITLPFISQGGSSLAASLAAMGILSNISKYRR